MRRGINWTLTLGVVCAFAFSAANVRATLFIDDVSITFAPPIKFYHIGTETFQPQTMGGDPALPVTDSNGSISLTGSGTFDYGFTGTVLLTPSELKNDNSSGGVADGTFYAGTWDGSVVTKAIMTITGNLFSKADPGTFILENKTLLIAEMTIHSPEMPSLEWDIKEGPLLNWVSGVAYLEPIGGELFDNAAALANPFKIGTYRAAYSFKGTSPSVFDFDTSDFTGFNPGSLQMTAVPEPATLLLLLSGGMVFARRIRRR